MWRHKIYHNGDYVRENEITTEKLLVLLMRAFNLQKDGLEDVTIDMDYKAECFAGIESITDLTLIRVIRKLPSADSIHTSVFEKIK